MTSITRKQFNKILNNKLQFKTLQIITENVDEFNDNIVITYNPLANYSDTLTKYKIITDDLTNVINTLEKIKIFNIKIRNITITIDTDEAIYLSQLLKNIRDLSDNNSLIIIKINFTDETNNVINAVNLQKEIILRSIKIIYAINSYFKIQISMAEKVQMKKTQNGNVTIRIPNI